MSSVHDKERNFFSVQDEDEERVQGEENRKLLFKFQFQFPRQECSTEEKLSIGNVCLIRILCKSITSGKRSEQRPI